MNDYQKAIQHLEKVRDELLQKAENLTTAIGLLKINEPIPELQPPKISEQQKKAEIDDILRRTDSLLPNHPARMNKDTDLNP